MKSFAHNKIGYHSPLWREDTKRKYKGPINTRLQYKVVETANRWATGEDLLKEVLVDNVAYRQLKEFPEDFISKDARILSMNRSHIRLLTPQFIKSKDGRTFGPVARIRSTDDHYYTRSARKLAREAWDETN